MTSGIENLIERQMRNWELARRQGTLPEQDEPTAEIQHYVAVSRQMGSRGAAVARRVGEKLNWHVYDREILTLMAEQNSVQRRIYALRDERHEGWLDSVITSLSPENPHQPDDYFHNLSRTVTTIARHQHAVFIGRGAQFVLPPGRGLSVRTIAAPHHCAANVARRDSIDLDAARRKVLEVEDERRRFLRGHFVPDPWSPEHYHLVINTGGLTIDAAADVILAALAIKTGLAPPT